MLDPSPVAIESPRLLVGRMRAIAAGVSGLPREKVEHYRELFAESGFALPPLESSDEGGGWRSARRRKGSRRKRFAEAFGCICRHLGTVLEELGEPQGERGERIAVHKCGLEFDRCVLTERDRLRAAVLASGVRLQACESCRLREATPRYVTLQQLASDTLSLASQLPAEITRIAGISRSGLSVATLLAKLLHVPLDIVRQSEGDIVSCGNGWRLNEGAPDEEGTVLVVDDTVMTGNSLKSIRPLAAATYRSVQYAAVYVNPLAQDKPDYWAVDLPWPHLLEWNLFNSVLTPACAFDFDGILCGECPADADDDGPAYERFLASARPQYLVRKRPIPLIVTARLERYRPQTEAWLKRWRIQVQRLEMGPWRTLAERRGADVAAFKAKRFQEFLQTRVSPGPHLFIESDPQQAARIADLSGGIVVCPAVGRCYP